MTALPASGGFDFQVVNVVAARIGRRFKVGAVLEAHHTTAAVDAELGRVGTATDAIADAAVAIGGRSPHGINRTRGVFGKGRAAAAGDAGRCFHHIAHRHRHAAGGDKGVSAFRGLDDDVITVVTARIGRVFKVGTADKADHPAAAVDAELGRVVPAADAVRHRSARHIGRRHCGIDRTGAVLGKAGTAAAGEGRGHIADIGNRHRQTAGRHKGVASLGG